MMNVCWSAAAARSSTRSACAISGASIISPWTLNTARPAAAASSRACITRSAHSTRAAGGVNASLITPTCVGWIASFPS